MHTNQNTEQREKSTPTPTNNNGYPLRPFAVVPFVIKTEQPDIEIMSDITIDTNTEGDDGRASSGYHTNSIQNNGTSTPYTMSQFSNESTSLHLQQQPHHQQIFLHSSNNEYTNIRNTIPNLPYVVAFNNDAPPATSVGQQIMTQSMVQLNDNNLLKSATHSDIEFVNNYLPTMSSLNGNSTNDFSAYSAHSPSLPKLSNTEIGPLIVANAKVTKTISISSKTTSSPPTDKESNTTDSIPTCKSPIVQKSETGPPTADAKKRTVRNRELQSIQKIDLTFKPIKLTKFNGAYPLRQKTKLNYSMVNRHKVINPANRLRQKIKTEMLSQSLPSSSSRQEVISVDSELEDNKSEDTKLSLDLKKAIEKIKIKKKTSAIEKRAAATKTNAVKSVVQQKTVTIENDDRFRLPSASGTSKRKSNTNTEIAPKKVTTNPKSNSVKKSSRLKINGAKLRFKFVKRS